MAKAVYTAYATLKNGASRVRDFGSQVNAESYARRIANELGACFVARVTKTGSTVVFNTHESMIDVIRHRAEISEEKACMEL
jgi:hypothetical protein